MEESVIRAEAWALPDAVSSDNPFAAFEESQDSTVILTDDAIEPLLVEPVVIIESTPPVVTEEDVSEAAEVAASVADAIAQAKVDTEEVSQTNTNMPWHSLPPTFLVNKIVEKEWFAVLSLLQTAPSSYLVPQLRKVDCFGNSPLHKACQRQPPLKVIQDILKIYPRAPKQSNRYGALPLHRSVDYSAHPTIIQALLEAHPAGVYQKDFGGWTPLHYAIKGGGEKNKSCLETMTLLLNYDVQNQAAKTQNENGQLPLHLACRWTVPVSVLDPVLAAHVGGVRTKDKAGRLPIHFLLMNRDNDEEGEGVLKRHRDLLQHLVDAWPEGACVPHVKTGVRLTSSTTFLLSPSQPNSGALSQNRGASHPVIEIVSRLMARARFMIKQGSEAWSLFALWTLDVLKYILYGRFATHGFRQS